MKTIALIFIIGFFSLLQAEEAGYVNQISVKQGDTLKFYISTQTNPFFIRIYKITGTDTYSDPLITTINSITGGERFSTDSCYYSGCKWPLSFSFVIPDSWQPGAYYGEFPTSQGFKSALFFISPRVRGSYSKILYLASSNTWEAFNAFGGKSLFDYNSSNGQRAYKVSFLRPGEAFVGYDVFYQTESPFLRWLYRNNINVEYAVNYNLNSDSSILKNYKIMVICGQNEFWSFPEKVLTENFVKSGGNLIILSGTTCFWQARYENNGNTLVCYQDPAVDPLNGIIDSLVTTNFCANPVNSPENTMTGISFIAGGYINDGSVFPCSDGYGGYTVINHHNWVYKNTGLMEGEDLGYADSIVGYATDGGLFDFVNGIPTFSGFDKSPTNFRVLGISPAYSTWGFTPNPHATMGIFHKPGGGNVFNAATIYWSLGLNRNFYVQTITKNVIDKFVANKFPPDIIAWTPFKLDSAYIHHENIPLNKRDFLRKDTSSVNLSVSAVDPYNGSISYQWLVNGAPLGKKSTISLNNTQISKSNKVNKIKVLVFNNLDTSEISWNYFNTELAIYSVPVTNVNTYANYLYRINIFNNYHDTLKFTLKGPSWLSINNNGELTGIAPGSQGLFPITIIVSNQHAQADSQSFVINDINTGILSSGIKNTPSNFILEQNFPNPFNPSTTIRYSLAKEGIVKITVYNLIGSKVATIVDEYKQAGNYSVQFSGSNLASGIYFYRLESGGFSSAKKFIMIK